MAEEKNPPRRFINRAGETRFTCPGWSSAGIALIVPTLDVGFFTPILITETRTFDRIGVNVSTAGASADVARLGIYTSKLNPAGLAPDGLLLDAGTVVVDTTGDKLITISQELTPGYYFLVLVSESGTYSGMDDNAAAPAPVTGFSATPGVALDNLVTFQTISSDWPSNGFPATAPVVDQNSRSSIALVRLRDST